MNAGWLALLLALAGCAAVAPSAQEQLRKVEAARTRADHEGLAAYAREAASAKASALEHRKMARGNFGASRGSAGMPAHCRRLAESYEARASEQEAMAFVQRPARRPGRLVRRQRDQELSTML